MQPNRHFNSPELRQAGDVLRSALSPQKGFNAATYGLNIARTANQVQDVRDKQADAGALKAYRDRLGAVPSLADAMVGDSVSGRGPVPMMDPTAALQQATQQSLPEIGLLAAAAGVNPSNNANLALSAPFEEAVQRQIAASTGNTAFNLNSAITPQHQGALIEDAQAHKTDINDASIAGAFARQKYSSDSTAANQRWLQQNADLILNQGQTARPGNAERARLLGVDPGAPVTGSFETSAGAVTDVPDGAGGFTRLEGMPTKTTAEGAQLADGSPDARFQYEGTALGAQDRNVLLDGVKDPTYRASPQYSLTWNAIFNKRNQQVTNADGSVSYNYTPVDKNFPPPTGQEFIQNRPAGEYVPVFGGGATPAGTVQPPVAPEAPVAPVTAPQPPAVPEAAPQPRSFVTTENGIQAVAPPAAPAVVADTPAQSGTPVAEAPAPAAQPDLSALMSGQGGATGQRKAPSEKMLQLKIGSGTLATEGEYLNSFGTEDGPPAPGVGALVLLSLPPDSVKFNLAYAAMPEATRQWYNSGSAYVEGRIRPSTGAAIKGEEKPDAMRIYVPMPGDTPQMLQKKRMRRAVIDRIWDDPGISVDEALQQAQVYTRQYLDGALQ